MFLNIEELYGSISSAIDKAKAMVDASRKGDLTDPDRMIQLQAGMGLLSTLYTAKTNIVARVRDLLSSIASKI